MGSETGSGLEVVPTDADGLDRAGAVLRSGHAIVMPTDTVYGLAVVPEVAGAIDQLFTLKDRSAGQPIAVLVADVAQALALVEPPSDEVRAWMDHWWPGPLTLVLRRSDAALGLDLGGAPATIGVRCPDHAFVRALAAAVGPIAATSANRSGAPTPATAAEAAASLIAPVPLVVDGGPAGTLASTVVDATDHRWRILREGAITAHQLRARP